MKYLYRSVILILLGIVSYFAGYIVAKVESYGWGVEPINILRISSEEEFEGMAYLPSGFTESLRFGNSENLSVLVFAGDGIHVSLFLFNDEEGNSRPIGCYVYSHDAMKAGFKIYSEQQEFFELLEQGIVDNLE